MSRSGVSLELFGLAEVRESLLSSRENKKLIPVFGLEIRKIQAELEVAVARKYATKKKLSSVLVGRSSSSITAGKNALSQGLTYKDVPLDLQEFVVGQRKVVATSKFFGKNPAFPNTLNKIVPKHWAMVVEVEVIRGQKKDVNGSAGYGAFVVGGWSKHVFMRKQKATWKVQPSKLSSGKRAPVRQLTTVSLAQMAANVYANDPQVKVAIDKFELAVIDTFLI